MQALSPDVWSRERRRRQDGLLKFDAPRPGTASRQNPAVLVFDDKAVLRLRSTLAGFRAENHDHMEQDMGVPKCELENITTVAMHRVLQIHNK